MVITEEWHIEIPFISQSRLKLFALKVSSLADVTELKHDATEPQAEKSHRLRSDLDLIFSQQCEQHKSPGIWSFQFWFGPLSYVVLNQIQVWFFAVRPQSEQSYQIHATFTSL